jgi:NADPH-dependent 2,4-dienoyl-CoA reductase/sulfur reductase-like enzyme
MTGSSKSTASKTVSTETTPITRPKKAAVIKLARNDMTSGRTFGYEKAVRNPTNIRNVGGGAGRFTGMTQRALKTLTGQ